MFFKSNALITIISCLSLELMALSALEQLAAQSTQLWGLPALRPAQLSPHMHTDVPTSTGCVACLVVWLI